MLIKFFLLILSAIILLTSCKGAQEALQGKSRADRSDEFLVEKKNPLSKNNNNSQNSNSNQKSLNKTILEKINDR